MHNPFLILRSVAVVFVGSCSNPIRLGLEDGRIQDSQITVKSSASSKLDGKASRLNLPKIPGLYSGAWRAEHGDNSPWIQVDFLRPVTVTGVITQGRPGNDQWVKTFKVKYRDDASMSWKQDPLLFTGNVDEDTPKENTLSTPKTHRFFAVYPRTWKNFCSMRLEFVGCYIGCRDSEPLGFANGLIHASQITASSYYSTTSAPQFGRLAAEVNWNGWRSAGDDSDPWLQVDFIAKVIVEEVQTHGRADKLMWTKTYKLLYGDDGYNFAEYSENGVPKVGKTTVPCISFAY
ncbi:Hypothetical predicted protein [Paramuricea clavata]|uniref:Uncharacterized protein n=1 Tax=Paramuricea clavata TaxID=317549 RepID=A0A6S7G8E4_PARCT|nr:Hypothetical predicted protein [Paramuricea clavata]